MTNENEDDSVEYTTLLSSSDSAYSKTNLQSNSYEKEEGDIDGPFSLGLKAVKTEEDHTSTLLAYSSEGLFTEDSNQAVSGANLQLFVNSLSSLVDHETTVSIAAKSYEISRLSMTQSQIGILALITTIVLPLVILIAGIIVWIRRRKA